MEKVFLVGAGPGDPELLTVKAARLIATADLIVYTDSLIPIELLQTAKPEAQLITSADKSLDEILAYLITGARSNQRVVRLQDGDPCLYGAIQEQMEGLLAAGIEFEVVPGVSAYQLAAARLRVELTRPQAVQSIILSRVSGRIEMPTGQELSALAASRSSLCLYLSAKQIDRAQAELLGHYPAETPVAICFHLGWADEQIILTSLQDLAQVNAELGWVRSTLYLVSPALRALTIPAQYQPEGWSADPVAQSSRLYDRSYDRWMKPASS